MNFSQIKYALLFCLISCSLLAEKIETFYGVINVEEPVLLELIESKSFQRLKEIHQYGVAYYTTHKENYNRYDHSLGVFAILRQKGASLEEQMAGLLHDVSHTIFSHVGEWIFKDNYGDKDYQTMIHRSFLEKYGIGEILKKYYYSLDQMMPTKDLYPMLEQSAPLLCADRIDYNIQGAYYQNFITYEESLAILSDLQFIEGDWVASDAELMAKIGRFSLYMTVNCWGSPHNYLLSTWLASAICRARDLSLISDETIHFGVDQYVWDILNRAKDPEIAHYMNLITSDDSCFQLTSFHDCDFVIKSKFRGIDPWILREGKKVRLTSIDQNYRQEYQDTRALIEKGWAVKLSKK